ncbi:MAG: DNA polymerase III subunit gamma/tau, partial [Sphingobacterium sp.]
LLKMCHISSAIQFSNKDSLAQAEQKKKLPESPVIQLDKPNETTFVKPILNAEVEHKEVQFIKNTITELPKDHGSSKNFTANEIKDPAAVVQKTTTAGKSWGNFKPTTAIPNLSTIFEDKQEVEKEENDLVEGDEYLAISQESFVEKWNTFANRIKKENKITLYTIMTSNSPVLEGSQIRIEVENAVQMEELKLGKIDILNYLRVELRNFALDLKSVMSESTKERKPYTAQEKYRAMVTKNPLLDELRKTFDLGLS